MKILYVCHGNVNRSAAAEIITKQNYPEHEVKSCGLKAKAGTITAKKMREALNHYGFKTEGIRSTEINEDLVEWADVIFYMDFANARRFFDRFGTMLKAQRLSFYAGMEKIPDPAFAKGIEEHKKVVRLLMECIANWVRLH